MALARRLGLGRVAVDERDDAALWLPLILLIAFALRALVVPGAAGRSGPDSAEEEARRAYARGDIDRERFQQVIENLREYRRGT